MPPIDPGPVPLQRYANWPGIEAPGHVRVNRTQLKAVADRLQGHLEDLLAADEHLTLPAPSAFGHWDAAQAFYPSVEAGHNALADQHSRVLHALMNMIKKLYRAAHAYDDAEADLERRIAEIDKRRNIMRTADLSGRGGSADGPRTPTRGTPGSLNPEARN